MTRRATHRVNGQRGVGLIEVLVAVLVMAIGLLGIAALQATALRNSQGSLERSQAVLNSYTMLDSMRVNVSAARAGAYDMEMTCESPSLLRPAHVPAQRLVVVDRHSWINQIKTQLASGCGGIACTAVAGIEARDCRVTIRWDDSRATGGSDTQEMTTVARL